MRVHRSTNRLGVGQSKLSQKERKVKRNKLEIKIQLKIVKISVIAYKKPNLLSQRISRNNRLLEEDQKDC